METEALLPVLLDGAIVPLGQSGRAVDAESVGAVEHGVVLGVAERRVPPVVARAPQHVPAQGVEDVVQRPRQHHDVVRVQPEGHHCRRVPNTYKQHTPANIWPTRFQHIFPFWKMSFQTLHEI